jgi:cobalt-zinc-cadmium efflux system protein
MSHDHSHKKDHFHPNDEHDHDHHHSHDHAHHHHGIGHSHAPKDFNLAFQIGVLLNMALVATQVAFGFIAHSLALVADAGHNFADVLGLMLAWWASKLLKSAPTPKHTYGFRSVSILAALTNAVLLLVTMGAVAWEAIVRLENPPAVSGKIVIWVAAAGIVINSVTALLFFSGRKDDLNIRGAFLHLAADAGISLGVVFAGLAILGTGKLWIDPVVSLVIVIVIVYGTWGLLKDSINLALHAVPEGIDIAAVQNYLAKLPGVNAVHDLHVWAMSTSDAALTAHLVMKAPPANDQFLSDAARELRERFKIAHATLQIEHGDAEHPCHLAAADTV